ncbi:Sensory neuron membrane protein 1 [Operophtera brumata]|uniref:Sensory neuron membrane protein 1 n=1 Tax=Operophtera brumata TaxID=104452 RepID=A0A0L7LM98_OPEBR|nr:Sensory neuron membrane protein 1 [Operophtera brumata]
MAMPRSLKYAAIGVGTALFGIILGWVLFPAILKSQLKKEMALSKKTDVRKMWEVIPFALDFKVYMFNYTNVEEIQKGGTPIVMAILADTDWEISVSELRPLRNQLCDLMDIKRPVMKQKNPA